MRVDLFDFDLPSERIALRPAEPRDSAKLLLLDAGRTADHIVGDLPGLLRAGDVMEATVTGLGTQTVRCVAGAA